MSAPARAGITLGAHVLGIGVLGPGIADWPGAAAVLTGRRELQPVATAAPMPPDLPAAERRRTGATVRLAMAAASQAVHGAGLDAARLASVFTSSGGDGLICHEICESLASADRQISPTRFHNSVHNAAAGYWSIATGATAPASVLCGYDASFAAGLIEALALTAVSGSPVLLAAYETVYPEPLRSKRPIPDSFAVALVLSPRAQAATLGRLALTLTGEPAEPMADAALERLRAAIPAARSLPLLALLARGADGRVVLDYLAEQRVALEVRA